MCCCVYMCIQARIACLCLAAYVLRVCLYYNILCVFFLILRFFFFLFTVNCYSVLSTQCNLFVLIPELVFAKITSYQSIRNRAYHLNYYLLIGPLCISISGTPATQSMIYIFDIFELGFVSLVPIFTLSRVLLPHCFICSSLLPPPSSSLFFVFFLFLFFSVPSSVGSVDTYTQAMAIYICTHLFIIICRRTHAHINTLLWLMLNL